MLAFGIVMSVLALLALGFLFGWQSRGQVGRWCPRDGDTLRCPTCSPLPPIGRAAVPWRQPPVSTVDEPLRLSVAQHRIRP